MKPSRIKLTGKWSLRTGELECSTDSSSHVLLATLGCKLVSLLCMLVSLGVSLSGNCCRSYNIIIHKAYRRTYDSAGASTLQIEDPDPDLKLGQSNYCGKPYDCTNWGRAYAQFPRQAQRKCDILLTEDGNCVDDIG